MISSFLLCSSHPETGRGECEAINHDQFMHSRGRSDINRRDVIKQSRNSDLG